MATKKKTSTTKVPTTSQVTAQKKAPVAKKSAAAKPKKTVAKKAPAATAGRPSPEERYRMIEQAAYYLAEKQGFKADPLATWIQAEREINARLAK